MEFNLKSYHQLLNSLQNAGYAFQSYNDFAESRGKLNSSGDKLIMLRHDVDKMPMNSLRFAKIQSERGIKATYYFRMHKHSYNEGIIKEIASLGHEIGYHYETMDTESSKLQIKGSKLGGKISNEKMETLIDAAHEQFCINLKKFREIAEINTISMHGSPLSPFDNRAIWQKYNYKELGIIAEPYFDLNFNEIYYITDTGRRWDGGLFNVRDKATKENPVTNPDFLKLRFHSTQDIIKAISETDNGSLVSNFPKKAMLNFHPQRWNDNPYFWTRELVLQNLKNQIKRLLVK